MPRIPDASQLGYSTPTTRTPRYQDRSGEIQADAVQGFARTLGQATDVLQEREDKFSYAQAKSTLLQADIEARRSLENDQDWETYEKRYSERMAKARETAVGQIRSKNDRALFDMDAKLDVERGIGEVRGIAKRKEVDTGRASLTSMLDSSRTAALEAKDEPTRASIIRNIQDGLAGAVEKGYITDQEKTNQSQQWSTSYAEGFLDIHPLDKRVDILKKPAGTAAQLLAPDRRANLLRQAENSLRIERDRAEAEQKTKLIEVRQALTDQLRDITVAAQMGLPVSVPSRDVLKTAFGEREGEQRYQLATKAANLSGDVASLQQLPTTDIVSRVESYKPTKTEGAADQAQLYGMMANSARDIIKARTDDPAGYLVQFAPKSQAAWQAFQKDSSEATRDSYLAAVDADRERLGLPKGDILPNTYAKAMAEEISSPQSAEKLATVIESEAQRWGDRWGDVHAQIAKDIPDIAAVIGSGIDRPAAVALASTAKLKDTELKAMLPSTVKWSDVQDSVSSTFDDVRRSFPAEGARTWQAIQDSATRLAVTYMQAGDNKENAVERAYKSLIGDQYAVGQVKEVPFLVPRQFDAGVIEDQARTLLDDIKIPDGMISVPEGEDASVVEARAKQSIRAGGYWVARGDGSGLRLFVGTKPTGISYSFEQFSEMAIAKQAEDAATLQRQRDAVVRARIGK